MKIKDEKEWILQAEYDLDAAEKLFRAGSYAYTVFLCHLSLEKALKAVHIFKFKKEPPKIHDLKTLVRMMNLEIPDEMEPFVGKLSAISIPARYPEDLKQTLKGYDQDKTKTILSDSKKALKWLKKQSTQK